MPARSIAALMLRPVSRQPQWKHRRTAAHSDAAPSTSDVPQRSAISAARKQRAPREPQNGSVPVTPSFSLPPTLSDPASGDFHPEPNRGCSGFQPLPGRVIAKQESFCLETVCRALIPRNAWQSLPDDQPQGHDQNTYLFRRVSATPIEQRHRFLTRVQPPNTLRIYLVIHQSVKAKVINGQFHGTTFGNQPGHRKQEL